MFDLEKRDRSFAYIAIDLFDRFMAATKDVEQVYTLCYAAACCMLAFKLNVPFFSLFSCYTVAMD